MIFTIEFMIFILSTAAGKHEPYIKANLILHLNLHMIQVRSVTREYSGSLEITNSG